MRWRRMEPRFRHEGTKIGRSVLCNAGYVIEAVTLHILPSALHAEQDDLSLSLHHLFLPPPGVKHARPASSQVSY